MTQNAGPIFGVRSLESRLRAAFRERGFELIQIYRLGRYSMKVLYKTVGTDHYWSSESTVERDREWTNATRDAELERLITNGIDEHAHGVEDGWGR